MAGFLEPASSYYIKPQLSEIWKQSAIPQFPLKRIFKHVAYLFKDLLGGNPIFLRK